MSLFIYACGLLLPWASVIMGFQYNYVMIAAAVGVLVEISRRGKLVRLADCWPAIAGTAGWIICNIFWGWSSEEHILNNKRAFLACGYGIPAGYLLQLSSRKGREATVLLAYVCFCLGLAVMAIKVIQFGNVEIEIQQVGGMTTRNMTSTQVVSYFRFFALGNLMMSSVIFTIPGMVLPVLSIMRVRWYILLLAFAAAGVGMVVAARMLTRTGVAGAGVAIMVMFVFVALKKGGRLSGIGRWLFPLIALMGMTAALAVMWDIPEFQTLLDRFRSAGEDGRQQLWAEAWDSISRRPWGGGMGLMGEIPWAHNIILDYALYNGAAGTLSMGVVYLMGGWRFIRLALDSKAMDSALVVTLATGFLSSVLIGMISPPDYGTIIYCYVFLGFSTAWLHEKQEEGVIHKVVKSNTTRPWSAVSPGLGSPVKS